MKAAWIISMFAIVLLFIFDSHYIKNIIRIRNIPIGSRWLERKRNSKDYGRAFTGRDTNS